MISHGSFVLLTGEPGYGKSQTVQWIANRLGQLWQRNCTLLPPNGISQESMNHSISNFSLNQYASNVGHEGSL
jgi:hypothetical protein